MKKIFNTSGQSFRNNVRICKKKKKKKKKKVEANPSKDGDCGENLPTTAKRRDDATEEKKGVGDSSVWKFDFASDERESSIMSSDEYAAVTNELRAASGLASLETLVFSPAKTSGTFKRRPSGETRSVAFCALRVEWRRHGCRKDNER